MKFYLRSKPSLILIAFGVFASNSFSGEYRRYQTQCMGTEFSILMDERNETICDRAAKLAFAEAERINRMCSDYEADSEISRLSESSYGGALSPVSAELFELLAFSRRLSVASDGAFDVTVGPASRLWRISRFRGKIPTQNEILAVQRRIGYEKLVLVPKERKAKLISQGMILDLGGVAKGYAADKMLSELRSLGIERCIIDAGGDLVIGKPPRGKKGWRIEIGGRKHSELPTLTLSDCAVATSGDTEQFLTIGDHTYSHIIDPRTAIGVTGRTQTTVIASRGVVADALASACLVLGKGKSHEIFHNYDLRAAYFLEWEMGQNVLTTYER